MLETPSKQITLTEEQFDDALKKWKKKGADRAFGFVFLGSLPLAVVAGFFFSEISSLTMFEICAAYYSGLAFLAGATQ
jgi:hypothetical protein